ncbi:MAG: S8 family serine peptidase, partial [Thermoplasmata archaeon]
MEGASNLSRTGRTIIALTAILIAIILIFAYFHYFPGLLDNDGDELPDWYVSPSSLETPEWTLDMTQVADMQSRGFDGTGIVIGIVDTGIDDSHTEFAPDTIIAWKDFVNSRTEPYDDGGHGTAMASIMVATGKLKGIAPMAKLIVAKAIPGEGGGDDATVGAAIDWCVDPNGDGDTSDGAHIISLSLGGGEHPKFGSASGAAARNAVEKGVVVIASAGNDGESDDGDVESPASEEYVIAVGAIDSTGTIASFSSIGDNDGRTPQAWDDRADPNKKPECVAPGVGIVAAFPDGRYATVSGTSPAAAFVSGVIALVLVENPDYLASGSSAKVLELKNAIMLTS